MSDSEPEVEAPIDSICAGVKNICLAPSPGRNVVGEDTKGNSSVLFTVTQTDVARRARDSHDFEKLRSGTDFTCITFNIASGSPLLGEKLPSMEERRSLTNAILTDLPADIYFLQEVGCTKELCLQTRTPNPVLRDLVDSGHGLQDIGFEEIGVGQPDTRIIFNKTVFEEMDLEINESTIDRFINQDTHIFGELDRGRFTLCRLKHKIKSFEFLAISWHGVQPKRTSQNPAFLKLVSNLCETLNLPCIIGADWNIDLGRIAEDGIVTAYSEEILSVFNLTEDENNKLEQLSKVRKLYIPTQQCFRDNGSKDFFVSVYPSMMISNVAEIPQNNLIFGESFAEALQELRLSVNPNTVLDHLPVKGDVVIALASNRMF